MNREIRETVLTAPEIVCGGCANAIRNAVGAIDGVENVEVDVDTKQVRVEHNENVERATIEQALDKAGFSVV